MAQWPEVPTAGESVRLPLALAPMLLEAVGYHGGARYVALYWSGGSGGDVMWSDGTTTATGWWPAWRLLTREHPLGRAILESYDMGDRGDEPVPAPHWLLCDRFEQTLWVAQARDVEALLATQPSELHAAARLVGAERVADALRRLHDPLPTPQEIAARMRRKQQLLAELRGWLDDLADRIQ